MDVNYSPVNIRRLLRVGREVLNAKRSEREHELAGFLRAGSAGCLSEGRSYGECHRLAHARLVGIEKPVSDDREIMFAAGEGNEDLWEQVLVPSWQGQVLRGQRASRTDNGITVIGSPDIVLANGRGDWDTILELKLVSSTNSAIAKHVHGKPDSKHLVQAATYMWMTGLPVILCYTSRTDFAVEFMRKKLGINKMLPFYRMFYLRFRAGKLYYRDEFETNEVLVPHVTADGIAAFFDQVKGMGELRTLHDRPSNDHVDGSPSHWERCDARYCALAETCDRYEHDYTTWLAEARIKCLSAT